MPGWKGLKYLQFPVKIIQIRAPHN